MAAPNEENILNPFCPEKEQRKRNDPNGGRCGSVSEISGLIPPDIAFLAMKVGTPAGLHDLKTLGDLLSFWRLPSLGLNHGRYPGLAALWAPQFLVPILNH